MVVFLLLRVRPNRYFFASCVYRDDSLVAGSGGAASRVPRSGHLRAKPTEPPEPDGANALVLYVHLCSARASGRSKISKIETSPKVNQ